jgi:hypothetical protein
MVSDTILLEQPLSEVARSLSILPVHGSPAAFVSRICTDPREPVHRQCLQATRGALADTVARTFRHFHLTVTLPPYVWVYDDPPITVSVPTPQAPMAAHLLAHLLATQHVDHLSGVNPSTAPIPYIHRALDRINWSATQIPLGNTAATPKHLLDRLLLRVPA